MELNEVKRVINDSSELSRQGKNQAALKLLDEAIASATRDGQVRWVGVLGRHASAIADHTGDLHLAREYRERCVTHQPDNPLTLSSLADALHKEGENLLARQYAVKAYHLSLERDTELDRAIVESLLQTWPDLAQSHP